MVAEVRPDSPAAIAGFLPGDRFVTVDGQAVETFADVQRLVSGRAGDPIVFVMLRDGKEVTLTATPGNHPSRRTRSATTSRSALIGVVNNEATRASRARSSTAPVGAVVEAVGETGHIIARTGQFLQRFVVGREDKCQLGGPVKIADMAGKAAQLGFEWLVQLVALLSVGIGILNLLPIPPLDGGHLAFYAIEAVKRTSGVRAGHGSGLPSRVFSWCWRSWHSCSGTICSDAESMNETRLIAATIEVAFTMYGDMRDANVTHDALSKHKLTRSLACRENPVNTVKGICHDVRFLAVGTSRKRLNSSMKAASEFLSAASAVALSAAFGRSGCGRCCSLRRYRSAQAAVVIVIEVRGNQRVDADDDPQLPDDHARRESSPTPTSTRR